MKILSLRLKNLNSLKGEWKIDFTQEPFASNFPCSCGCLRMVFRAFDL